MADDETTLELTVSQISIALGVARVAATIAVEDDDRLGSTRDDKIRANNATALAGSEGLFAAVAEGARDARWEEGVYGHFIEVTMSNGMWGILVRELWRLVVDMDGTSRYTEQFRTRAKALHDHILGELPREDLR